MEDNDQQEYLNKGEEKYVDDEVRGARGVDDGACKQL
jgi:hypothetical protein